MTPRRGRRSGRWTITCTSTASFWEGCGYDFAGGIERSSVYSASHINKCHGLRPGHSRAWVVHQGDVRLPGRGQREHRDDRLSPTQAQTTDNAWKFAVQGVLAADNAVELSATTTDAPMANGTNGYRFVGWCREPSVTVNEVAEDPAYFEPMVTGDWVSDSPVYELRTPILLTGNSRTTTCSSRITKRRCCSTTWTAT